MKAFEDLVEEVYHDGDLQPEFTKYAQLITRARQHRRQLDAQFSPVPARHYQFLGHAEIGKIGAEALSGMSEEQGRLRRGLTILSSTLFKTLSLRYPLPKEELLRLREAVAARYAQTL